MRIDYEKIVQAINFFARKNKGHKSISKLYFLKLIFLADRYHLRMYGRLITNNRYVAMKYGPVASESKKIFEFMEFLDMPESCIDYAAEYLDPLNDTSVVSLKEVDKDVFSETDLEALESAYKAWRNHSYDGIVTYVHKFPEWANHLAELETKRVCDMSLEDFFLDAPANAEYCPADADRVALNKEHFLQMEHLM